MALTSQLGRGTTVELWLPQSNAKKTVPRLNGGTRADLNAASLSVLVVDDDHMIMEVTAAILDDLGHTAIPVNSGQSALDYLRSESSKIDLVLTDHAMPGMTGVELAARIREVWSGLPVILASGYAEIPVGEGLGLVRLAKPYRPEDLNAAVLSAMAKRETERQLETHATIEV